MVTKIRSLISGIVLALLFFGPSTSNAQAKDGRGEGRGHDGHSRHYGGGSSRHSGYGHYGVRHSYGYVRPSYGWGYGPYTQPYFNPYRTVRVFVAFPFPHWVLRQVNYWPPVAAPYYSPY